MPDEAYHVSQRVISSRSDTDMTFKEGEREVIRKGKPTLLPLSPHCTSHEFTGRPEANL
jgi:hypothetical protein